MSPESRNTVFASYIFVLNPPYYWDWSWQVRFQQVRRRVNVVCVTELWVAGQLCCKMRYFLVNRMTEIKMRRGIWGGRKMNSFYLEASLEIQSRFNNRRVLAKSCITWKHGCHSQTDPCDSAPNMQLWNFTSHFIRKKGREEERRG